MRALLPGVGEGIASALNCPLSQVLVVVSFDQNPSSGAALLAANCSKTPVEIANAVAHPDHDYFALIFTTEPFPSMPFFRNVRPYPGMSQQHALHIDGTTFLPYPVTNAQLKALQEHGSDVLLQSRSNDRYQFPPVPEKACFACGAKAAPGPSLKLVCSACKHARYCSITCKKANWKLHKNFCQNYRVSTRHLPESGNLLDECWPVLSRHSAGSATVSCQSIMGGHHD